jgi:hypothetical protein
MAGRRKGPGPSSVLITPDCAGNVVGVDPDKRTLSATIADPRGGILASEHFRVSGDGHRALEVWAGQFGPIARWGVEGASSWGRHTAIFLIARGHDVRDVCANRHAAVWSATPVSGCRRPAAAAAGHVRLGRPRSVRVRLL